MSSSENQKTKDLRFGLQALKVAGICNSVLVLVLLVAATVPSASGLWEVAMWLVLVEALLLLVVFLPVVVYRIIVKKEFPKLAASRAAYWFVDAIGLV